MSRMSEQFQPETYGGFPGFKESTTSRDVALKMAGEAKVLRERAFAEIAAAGARGLTADEVATRLGRTVLSCRPRVAELAKGDNPRIVRTGERRLNASGNSALVWKAA